MSPTCATPRTCRSSSSVWHSHTVMWPSSRSGSSGHTTDIHHITAQGIVRMGWTYMDSYNSNMEIHFVYQEYLCRQRHWEAERNTTWEEVVLLWQECSSTWDLCHRQLSIQWAHLKKVPDNIDFIVRLKWYVLTIFILGWSRTLILLWTLFVLPKFRCPDLWSLDQHLYTQQGILDQDFYFLLELLQIPLSGFLIPGPYSCLPLAVFCGFCLDLCCDVLQRLWQGVGFACQGMLEGLGNLDQDSGCLQ